MNNLSLDRFVRPVVILFFAILLAALAIAQVSTARFEGTVIDPAGAVVANATVKATNNRTGIVSTVTTNEHGLFVFASLPPSVYTIEVEVQGFRKAVLANMELNASAPVSEIIKLEVGSIAESVTVEATAVKVQTADAQMGRSVTLKDIDTLPSLARGPLALAIFAPGVQIDPSDSTFSRVNGARQGSNNTKLDGIDANDAVVPRFGLSLTAVNTDSVEELRVITNGGKAEYGRNAGGQIEMVTRSGTNEWHGNAFEYLRNTKLNANQFFSNSAGVARPKFIQNIYGFSLGAPIMKDRTFIFGNFQGRRTAQDRERNRTVLTPEAKSGLFRWRASSGAAVQSFGIPGADPTGRGIDPKVKELLALLPDPNNTDVGDGLNTAGFRFNNPAGSFEDQFTIRGDHNLWQGHRLFYRHSWQRNESIDALNNADAAFPGRPQGKQGGHRWGYSIGSDWSIRPTLINEARFGYQSASVAFLRPDRLQGPAIIPNLYTNPILPNFAQGRNSPVYDFANNLTWVKNKHTFKAGFTTRQVLQYGWNDAGIYPNVNLTLGSAPVPSSIGPSGLSSADRQRFDQLYNDLLGRVSDITQTFYSDLDKFQAAGTPRVRNLKFGDYAWFVQDDWKVRSNLVLNIGLRWDFYGAPKEQDRLQGTIDRINLANTQSLVSDFKVVRTSQWYNSDKNNFAPRIGFAWDPRGNGKTSIRGGYGIFYDRIIGATASLVDGNTPGFAQGITTLAGVDFPVDQRISQGLVAPSQPSAPITQQPVTRQTSIVVFPEDMPTGYVQHMNLNVQHEIFRNTVIDVGYVRTRGLKLFTWLDINQPRIYGDFASAVAELNAFRTSGTAPSANNTLVRIFGTPSAAVTALGATNLANGLLGTIADTVDRNNYRRYAAAGVSDFYLRNFPQYNLVIEGSNNGRSWYDSLQVTFRRQTGDVKFVVNYTFSKTMDNSSVDGNGFTAPIDNANLWLNKARSDYDRPHSLNYNVIWTLPVGRGKQFGSGMPAWANAMIGGWDLGVLGVWQSGGVFTVSSGRRTAGSTATTWANYSGDRNIGEVQRQGNGVIWFTPEQVAAFGFPGAGQIGTSGRNGFRGPRYFNLDTSIVKRFPMPFERHFVQFRAEMYNTFNNTNFGNPGTSIVTPASFGRISSTVGNARIMQMALRYDF
jgi:hypothetical protein